MKVQIVNDSVNAIPEYANPGDAGMDIRADFSKSFDIKGDFCDFDEERQVALIFSGGRMLIPTNIKVAIPKGYEIQVRPRSGLALKEGITVLNTPGTIDSGYRNYIGVILVNLGEDVFEVNQGDRIAQIVLKQVEEIEWDIVWTLDNTDRGLTGFGDSGIK